MTNYKRVAIYFLPKKNSSLENFGKNLLGRDINKKKKISLTRRQKYFINRGFTYFDELKDYCEQPAKYGFHATLKAPFRLKRNVKTKNFYDVISHIAAQHSRFKIKGLKIVYSKKFTFITSRKPNKLLINLESDLVKHLDTFRAELNKTEIKKRIPDSLTFKQNKYLKEWGYPFVFDQFKFHMTLMNQNNNKLSNKQKLELEKLIYKISNNVIEFNEISLLGENKNGHFEEIKRFKLNF
jgi:hypothetical protein